MSIAAGGAPSLIMLKPFPCNAQSTAVKNLTLLCHPTMEDQEEKENQYDNANSPPNQALTRSMGEHGSNEEESEHDAQDDPALLRVEIDVPHPGIRSPNMHEVHSVGLSDPMHDESFHGRTPGMASTSPFALGADASVQVNSPSLEERNAVEGMAILRSSSRDAALDYMPPGNNRFAPQPTDYVARMPTDEAPPPPDDNEFTEGSWSEIPFFPESMHYPFEYPYSYNHHGYHRHQSEDTPTPHVVRATKEIPTTASDDSGNSSLDKKPAAKSRQTQNKNKEKVKVKEEKNPPKRKSRPQKIRTRTERKSTGSGSDSSPTSQSSGGASRNSRSRPGYYPVPDKEELDAATTDRSRDALISWHQRLGELIDYRKKHGNSTYLSRLLLAAIQFRLSYSNASTVFTANVPQKFEKNRGLGVWVNKQRMEKKVFDEGKKTSMTAKKIAKLEKAGFQW